LLFELVLLSSLIAAPRDSEVYIESIGSVGLVVTVYACCQQQRVVGGEWGMKECLDGDEWVTKECLDGDEWVTRECLDGDEWVTKECLDGNE
jgi:hypothetical protein